MSGPEVRPDDSSHRLTDSSASASPSESIAGKRAGKSGQEVEWKSDSHVICLKVCVAAIRRHHLMLFLSFHSS